MPLVGELAKGSLDINRVALLQSRQFFNAVLKARRVAHKAQVLLVPQTFDPAVLGMYLKTMCRNLRIQEGLSFPYVILAALPDCRCS